MSKLEPIVMLTIYITYIVAITFDSIGKPYEPGIYSWYLPFEMLIAFGFPALLGYWIGKSS